MAVDSKQGGTNAPGPGPGPAATLAGMPAVQANGAFKRKRPSSLMAQASALPSVENSLDEFIAKANETLVDPSTFNSDQVRREEDDKRKEHDALRWKATEQQMRESQAREDSLRRQLDGLQGKLAEAEARAAVAGSGGSQDGIIADLKLRLTMADDKIATSEQKLRLTEAKVGKLETELVNVKSTAATAAAAPAVRDSVAGIGDDEAEQRVRIAEAKAVKALAIARAASAGLTVSAADINAIESGLVVTNDFGPKKTPWGAIVAGSLVSAAIAFTIAFVMFGNKKESPKAAAAAPAAAEQQPQGAAAPAPAAPAKPTATPIEEPAAKAEEPAAKAEEPAEEAAAKPVEAEEAEAPVVAPKAPKQTAAAAKAEKAAAAKAAAQEAAAAKAEKAAAAKAAAKATKKAPAKKSSESIADPFGDSPAPAAKKAPAKAKAAPKKDSGIVDPF